jgi:hypothetical protein
MIWPDPNSERDVLIYLSYKPAKTYRRILRFHESLQKLEHIDFHIVTYDEAGNAGTRSKRFGDTEFPHSVYNLASVRAIGYPEEVHRSSFNIKDHGDIPILLFWRDHPEYRRYWRIEDDVEYTGDFGTLINRLETTIGNSQLLCTHLRFLPKDWDHIRMFSTGSDTLPRDHPLRVCFLPFCCATGAALATIDAAYWRRWSGHFEMVWPNVLDFAGMPIRDMGGAGPFVAPGDRNRCYIDRSPNDYQKRGSFGTIDIRLTPGREPDILWHPVKRTPEWITARYKRIRGIFKYYLPHRIGSAFDALHLRRSSLRLWRGGR